MNFSALNNNRLYLKVADKILASIKSKALKIGERMPSERVLSSDLNVSRATVREALVALELAGIVEIKTASGIFVKKIDFIPTALTLDKGPGPFEILEARRILESEACALAAVRISDKQLQALDTLITAMEKENQLENPTEKADQTFHCLIADAAENSVISSMINWLWALRKNSELSTHFHYRVRLEGIRPIISDHREILRALTDHNADAARRAMQNHLQRVIDGLISIESK